MLPLHEEDVWLHPQPTEAHGLYGPGGGEGQVFWGRGWWDVGGDVGATCSCQQRGRTAPLPQGRFLTFRGDISVKRVGSNYLHISPGGSRQDSAQTSLPFIPLGKVGMMTLGPLPTHTPHPRPQLAGCLSRLEEVALC